MWTKANPICRFNDGRINLVLYNLSYDESYNVWAVLGLPYFVTYVGKSQL